MKRLLLISFFVVLFVNFAKGQNLVPNPSFEQILNCNLSSGGIDTAVGWWDIGSADLFNSCTIQPFFSVPNNDYGNQVPFEGNGYAFFLTYAEPPSVDVREYAQSKLIDTLLAGIKYYASFRISFADTFKYATDGVGAFFSMDTIFGVGPGNIVDSIPQIEVPVGIPITDKINWTMVEGSFIAVGGEAFITIGNFKHDSQLITQNLGGNDIFGGYYLDGVCVSVDSLECYNFVGIEQQNHLFNQVVIYPNPSNSILNFDISNLKDTDHASLVLYDINGKEISRTRLTSYNNQIDVSAYSKGIYFYRILNNEKTPQQVRGFSGKVVIQ